MVMPPSHRIELDDGTTVEVAGAPTARAAARHTQRTHRDKQLFRVTDVVTGHVKTFLRAGARDKKRGAKGMWEIRHKGSGSMIKIRIPPGKTVYADNSTFLSGNQNLSVGTIEQPITGRFTGQSNVLMELASSSKTEVATVGLAPVTYGDMERIDLRGRENIMVRKGAYVASDACGALTWKWVSEFSRWSPMNVIPTVYAVVKATDKTCSVFITGSGSIERIRVTRDNPVKISMGHDLAWSSHLSRSKVSINESLMGMFSSWRTQGVVHKFSTDEEPGYVWVQTRTNDHVDKSIQKSAKKVAAKAIQEAAKAKK